MGLKPVRNVTETWQHTGVVANGHVTFDALLFLSRPTADRDDSPDERYFFAVVFIVLRLVEA